MNGEFGDAVPFSQMRVVPGELLEQRLEEVKKLAEDENEGYRIAKDKATGEHYLHLAVRHLNVAAGGAEELFHQLMPLEYDDVISLALGDGAYRFPEHWRRPFLRNGPDGGYVWYDPQGAEFDEAAYDAAAEAMKAKLLAFRRSGSRSEADVRKLLEEIDRLFPPEKPDEP
jgi:hypothetical protein